MRKKIVAGNWKMNLTKDESIKLVKTISTEIQNQNIKNNRIIIAPVSINLHAVLNNVGNDKRIEYASQNMHFANNGAFTGEVSASILKGIGIYITLIGHSERRVYFNEDTVLLKKKVDQALNNNIEIIFCFGEELEDRESKNQLKIVENQLKNTLFHLKDSDWKNIILAYEPVWAIGTGMTASPEQAQEMHAFIRNLVAKNYNETVAENVSILYGGSVKPTNAKEIFSKPDVDGGLIGGAALKAKDFAEIIKAIC
ncbi:MAG: triose-phosphate isomerase [Flavobacteriaceae bacterium]|nr:triose-phosphate isomerase [Flavobacteriaceae bacterium]